MKTLTEWEISREATNRLSYLRKKIAWRGFIEGALWMQSLHTEEGKAILEERDKKKGK